MKKKETKIAIPKDQDHLEVYPEKKQVSAFPERRFIKTNRMLVIFALINLACMLAGAGIFIYTAKRVNVDVQNKKGTMLYQLDREEKKLKQAEYMKVKVSAQQFIIEDFLRRYITERHSFNTTLLDSTNQFSSTGLVIKSSLSAMEKQIRTEFDMLQRETQAQNKIRDVHIFNLHPYYGNLWTAVIETFDFPNKIGTPDCDCYDNSPICLKCKYEKTLLRQRRRIWIRISFRGKKDLDINNNSKNANPFGILVEGYYIGYMPKDPVDRNWDLPAELR